MICTHMDHCYPLDHVDGTPCFCGKRRWNDDGVNYSGMMTTRTKLPHVGEPVEMIGGLGTGFEPGEVCICSEVDREAKMFKLAGGPEWHELSEVLR